MAKIRITRECGHQDTIQVYGPARSRTWKIKQESLKLCRDCYIAEQRSLDTKETAQLDLPTLTGSEKQVAWAISLRLKALRGIKQFWTERREDAERSGVNAEQIAQASAMVEDCKSKLLAKTDATWWIDQCHLCRGDSYGGRHLLEIANETEEER